MNQHIEKRSDRRLKNSPYKGKNKRKNIGKRKHERYSVVAYNAMLFILFSILIILISFIILNQLKT